MIFHKICIVGLGLIGGSLAKAIKRSFPNTIINAVDNDEESLEKALTENIIQGGTSNVAEGIQDVDLIFLCTPIHTMEPLIKKIMPLVDENTIVTDTGSTKQNIMETVDLIRQQGNLKGYFIGGHPMAGTQYSGYNAAIPHLFENAYYVLTPTDQTPPHILELLQDLLASIGAIPLVMEGKIHDKIIGAISHLPHVVAAALVNVVKDKDDPAHLYERLAAGGFRDITRIASSNPEMWKDISLANKDELINLTSNMIQYLKYFADLLAKDKADQISDYFASAKVYRGNLPIRQALNLLSKYDLYIDVVDRPGIIGNVTTILGQNKINIKNLRIVNSREEEPGSLVISFSNAEFLYKAQKILIKRGFRVFTQ